MSIWPIRQLIYSVCRYFLNFKKSGGESRDFIQMRLLRSNNLIDCTAKPQQIIMLRGACRGACWPTERLAQGCT